MDVSLIHRRRRRRLTFVASVFVSVLAVFASALPASAADPDPGTEGGSAAQAAQLEQLATSFYTAQNNLLASQKRQADLTIKLRDSQLALARLTADIDVTAAARYESGSFNVITGLFTSGPGVNPHALLQGAAMADYLIWRDNEQLTQYKTAHDDAARDQAELNDELKIQAKAAADLDAQKRSAEKALAAVGGMITAGYDGPVQAAQAAPRNPDGSFPRETMSVKDPTGTGGKITPRMYHTLIEAQLAGFTRYTRCWRTQSWGEHPKGRACDFSATKDGFAGIAAGDDKAYGTKLAAWGIANAQALGIMYVIWFKQIWMPGIGWRAYTTECCDPSGAHENHVHISVL
jgi:peptidoglycan DL-endopeptidase CwlO